MTDEWLNCSANLHALELIDLWGTKVTGRGFSALQGLTSLREVRLYYTPKDEGWVRPNLNALRDLPALETVHLGGVPFGPNQLAPLGQCGKLKELRIWDGGIADDSTALDQPTSMPQGADANRELPHHGHRRSRSRTERRDTEVDGLGICLGIRAQQLAMMKSLRFLVIDSSRVWTGYSRRPPQSVRRAISFGSAI